ncbi:hypothetical protein GCM10010211_43320 [Streptomyces albospinus]|uniref:Uncharacterized protein n=1 Tax=Streptomyces albospinus TaxID=285515 RepID=A0ABQ2V9M1_9ACTN|nr:hypothetical protein GCM10010211_43320 [Streptomyces albospinus]
MPCTPQHGTVAPAPPPGPGPDRRPPRPVPFCDVRDRAADKSDGAHARLCTGSDGAGCNYDMAAQNGVWADLTPINSMTLDRP